MNALRKYESEPVVQPICNVDGEGAIIGSILVNNDAFQLVAGILQPMHFFDKVMGEIYEVISTVIKQGRLPSRSLSSLIYRGTGISTAKPLSVAWCRAVSLNSPCRR